MHRNPSVMQHVFSQVPRAEIQRSTFDRSHGHKTTFDAGLLIPILIDEALPGDTFRLSMTGFCRLATPIYPIMDNMYMDTFFFSVPYRLVWSNWERFNGAQDDPGDSTDFVIPQMDWTGYSITAGDVFDYAGLPMVLAARTLTPISCLPFRAMNLIWREWFRDQNLQDSPTVSLGNGPDLWSLFPLRRRGKRHDYFTSCLPWPQKGPGVSIPLGTSATVRTGTAALVTGAQTEMRVTQSDGAALGSSLPMMALTGGGSVGVDNSAPGVFQIGVYPHNLYADLSTATAATINSLRQAFQIQKVYERDARGGTRYVEQLKAQWGVTSPDFRLQRPEFLGGGSSPVNVSPVPQTSSTDATTPQGNLAAMGTVTLRNHGFTHSFTEHCIVIGFVSVRADLTYQQGLERMWSRRTRFDHFLPALAHIGEQAVISREIFADGAAGDSDVFGYQERYAEYRYKPSKITGEFRSSFAQSLDAWHLSQDFAARPTLSAAFIEENPPVDRVIAVTDEPHFIGDFFFDMRCARPMPLYGVPGLIDHF